MKFRKIAIGLLLLSLFSGSVVYASGTVQKVRLIINGIESDDGGVTIDGKTYLPLKQLASSMQAIIEWDNTNKRATVFKPNVHMFLYNGNTPFGIVDKGFQGKIQVFSQVDNLKKEISAVKVTITDPSGKEKLIETKTLKADEVKSNMFWFRTGEFDFKFDSVGQYTVRFSIKPAGSEEWSVVSEKIVTSKNP
ncbi:copper amine oxidase [Paenibacillus sp. GSMTC-2017]|uniref:stalk domain-containing protein n=1 Tax=Paenibacillus sp. GSMTC-2017 TaxID=2794350 RepID=UPI0018D8D5F1|nr:stalk domain-containing protein [Paenibacillus sp. GSMTC-2017]MBH5316822.1 copper amine oxidase [Paenibacillus sp. GSMTC-2017]